MINLVRRYTIAPEVYDGFGTTRTGHTVRLATGKRVAEVKILSEYLEWQETHYGTGLHLCIDEDKLKEFV